ncbi:hypothetical protein AB0L33_31680 [Streptomyces sp. NPDC052299]|uniref:hypothetical protein n=1 Tax=Streptomyces sp. NPDC052299 TaxID=3155054 RepID=UPI00341234C4
MSVCTTFAEPLAGGRPAGGRETDGDGEGDPAADAVGECDGGLAPAGLPAPSCELHPAASSRAPAASTATAPRRAPGPLPP